MGRGARGTRSPKNFGSGVRLMKPSEWLTELLASLPPALEEPPKDDTDFQHFDPDQDDLGDVLWEHTGIYEDRLDEALKWLDETVGLDFSDLQARWKEVPFILVSEHISEERSRLLNYLDQIRLAYVVGADLAAATLCRATTELLIRYYYANHVLDAQDSRRTKLTRGGKEKKPSLIEHAEAHHEFLKCYNLDLLVRKAHEILHAPINDETIEGVYSIKERHRNPARELVRCWFRVLEEMVDKVQALGSIAVES